MGEKVPGIARNSCPLCGELVPVHWWRLLPSRSGPTHVRCPSCKGRVVVARSTGFMAMFGSTVLGLVGAAVAIRLTGSNGLAICTGSIAGTVLGAGLMGKLGLRLEVEGFD